MAAAFVGTFQENELIRFAGRHQPAQRHQSIIEFLRLNEASEMHNYRPDE